MAKARSTSRAGRTSSRPSTGTTASRQAAPAGEAKAETPSHRWTFLTNHSHILVLLDSEEAPVLREVALQVGITERAVQRIILDLEEGGFIERERIGRRNRYRVMKDQTLRHPIESHRTIGELLELIAPQH